MATRFNDPCRNESAHDEPLFTLCGRDPFAPPLVRHWAELALSLGQCSTTKHDEAMNIADKMEKWQATNPDTVTPMS